MRQRSGIKSRLGGGEGLFPNVSAPPCCWAGELWVLRRGRSFAQGTGNEHLRDPPGRGLGSTQALAAAAPVSRLPASPALVGMYVLEGLSRLSGPCAGLKHPGLCRVRERDAVVERGPLAPLMCRTVSSTDSRFNTKIRPFDSSVQGSERLSVASGNGE